MKKLVSYFIVFLLGAVLVACNTQGDADSDTQTPTEYVTVTQTRTVEVEVPGELSQVCLDMIDATERMYQATLDVADTESEAIELATNLQEAMVIEDFQEITILNANMQQLVRDLGEYYTDLAQAQYDYEQAKEDCV